MEADIKSAIDAIWKSESARVIGGLTRMVRDVGVAEDLAHDALVAALEQWPGEGLPENPGAWLMTAAKRRAIDLRRHENMTDSKRGEIARRDAAAGPEAADDDHIGDDALRLMFLTCHPVLPPEARVALTLKLVGGLATDEIARAYLTTEPAIAQRIVRAKRTLADEHVPFEIPRGGDRAARVSSVLAVVYLIFNEGYSATAGDDWMRPALCDEAIRIGRLLAQLSPGEPEAHGLVALMEIQASRSAARVAPSGEPVLLLDQDRSRWDPDRIRRGLESLDRAGEGPYGLQAAIAACHARAKTAAETDWKRIAALYGKLAEVSPSPVVELNRAVAVGMADGPAAGLAIADRLQSELKSYHLLPAVRGDLLSKLGRYQEAKAEFERAAGLTKNRREQQVLLGRAEEAAQKAG